MSKLRFKNIDIVESEVQNRIEAVSDEEKLDIMYKALSNKISSDLDADDIVGINIDTTYLHKGKLVARVFYKVALGE